MTETHELKKSRIYYLYSSGRKCEVEAVYVCDKDKYIDSATLQTGVYPLGVLLSKTIELLSPCLINGHNPFIGAGEDELFAQFHEFVQAGSSQESPSFSSDICDDTAAQMILKLLLIDRQYLEEDNEKYDRLFELLVIYTEYINLCLESKEFCKSENLRLLSEKNRHSLPTHSIYTAKEFKNETSLTKDTMADFLRESHSPNQFAPNLKRQRKTLWELSSPDREIKTTQWAPLEPPIHVFVIHDIVDLILASLQCIFEKGNIIKKCFYCGSLFVTHKGNQEYCPATANTKSCYQSAKLQRQLEKERSGSVRLHKIIRTMYGTDYGTTSEIYRNFCKESQIWRNKIKAKEATEEEYVAWLKTKFRRKYRKKGTAAET